MIRSAVVVALALLALAACGSTSDGSSIGKNTATSGSPALTSPSKQVSEATTVARRLGCASVKTAVPVGGFGLPAAIARVDCIADGVAYSVNVYARPADLLKLFDASSAKTRCALASALHVKGSLYSVKGKDYTVTSPDSSKPASVTLANAKAAGRVLGLPVETTTCPG